MARRLRTTDSMIARFRLWLSGGEVSNDEGVEVDVAAPIWVGVEVAVVEYVNQLEVGEGLVCRVAEDCSEDVVWLEPVESAPICSFTIEAMSARLGLRVLVAAFICELTCEATCSRSTERVGKGPDLAASDMMEAISWRSTDRVCKSFLEDILEGPSRSSEKIQDAGWSRYTLRSQGI